MAAYKTIQYSWSQKNFKYTFIDIIFVIKPLNVGQTSYLMDS